LSSSRRKPEDSVDGCRALAASDRERALATTNNHARATFERSAGAWSARAALLERLETSFEARATGLARATKDHETKDRQNG